jgi:predicted permease
MPLTEAEYLDLRDNNRAFENVGAYGTFNPTLSGTFPAERVNTAFISASIFPMLGAQIVAGRALSAADDLFGAPNVVVLRESMWHRRFGSDLSILRKAIRLNNASFTVVGIVADEFALPAELQGVAEPDLYIPLVLNDAAPDPGNHYLKTLVHLRNDVTHDQSQQDFDEFKELVRRRYPDYYPDNAGYSVHSVALTQAVTGDVSRALIVLLSAVVTVLLIACVNVANLLMARAASRQREFAIRRALGASSARIIGQLLTESSLLAGLGGVLGLALAVVAVDTFVALGPINLPRLQEVQVDEWVLMFTFSLSILAGVIFGLAPAWQARGIDAHGSLKDGSRISTGISGTRVRQILTIAEVALALMLLVGAGLLTKSFWKLRQIDPGFNSENVLTLRLDLPRERYPENHQILDFRSRLIEQIRGLPGVKRAALASNVPLKGRSYDTMFQIEGRSQTLEGSNADFGVVNPGYFRVMGIPIIRGREFITQDTDKTMLVAIVNGTLARRQWPNQNPIGKRIRLLDAPESTLPYMSVVGIADDAKNRSLGGTVRQQIYVPDKQYAISWGRGADRRTTLAMRTEVDPAKLAGVVREKIRLLDPDLPITDVRTLADVVRASIERPRFNMMLVGSFAALAVFLAAVGIYGLMAYFVRLRFHEIGVRMALGATRADIGWLVLGQAFRLMVAGLTLGLLMAWFATKVLASMLYEVSPTDILTFTSLTLLLAVIALMSAYFPMRQATRVDPMTALRVE